MIEDRWEHGSDQHWQAPTGNASYPWPAASPLFGCGRHANAAAVRASGCTRLWIPSFYCQEVAAAFPVRLASYADRPGAFAASLEHLPFEPGDAVLVVNTLGLRARPPAVPAGVTVIEDHTHDLTSDWAFASRADLAVASLRKILPVPDGGVLWSPTGRALGEAPVPHATHVEAALDRLSAMILKASYLDGAAISKGAFRALALAGERTIAEGDHVSIAPITRELLPAFPVAAWRSSRQRNFTALAGVPGLDVLAPEPGAVPYVVTLRLPTAERRETVRAALIRQRIYPAVLWSLEQPAVSITDDDLDLSRRILSLHCDQRYTTADMQRVAAAVVEAQAS